MITISGVLDLITEAYTVGDDGIPYKTETIKPVLCGVASIGMREWFEGGRNGLNPQLRFDVFSGDYDGQELCAYQGKRYQIYRTYTHGDQTELYVERRKGNA